MNETRPKVFIDHINNNKNDNRKSNLRESTVQLNAQNASKRAGSTSKYYGVFYDKYSNTWTACLTHKGKRIFKKYEHKEINAALRRDLFVLTDSRLVGSHYKLNFNWKRSTYNPEMIKEYLVPFPEEKDWAYNLTSIY